ncbi:MAG: D-alanine--D-alanine ligase [Planctomycetota bacterium]|nr:D-alanine--D-alanine ligase [Planctomycetota bacterium]
MNVLVLHTMLDPSATDDQADVLVQAAAVEEALRTLGHSSTRAALPADPEDAAELVRAPGVDAVFNLVESIGGDDSLAWIVPEILEDAGVAFTGCTSAATAHTLDKLAAKRTLLRAGLPTPRWLDPLGAEGTPNAARAPLPGTFILKSATAHASVGIDDAAVVAVPDSASLRAAIRDRRAATGLDDIFAESYIDGREFNISLLSADPRPGGDSPPQVLAPAEIVFKEYASAKPHIVGYDAKWKAGSFEYEHTPRRFDFPASDEPLLETLRELSRRCWGLFGLSGYARVDFRVDTRGAPFILEINTNPCLSPDAGFAAALAASGIRFDQAVARLLAEALARQTARGGDLPGPSPPGLRSW